MRKILAAFLILLLPLTSAGQEAATGTSAEDRDFLTALLEDNLSGAGRAVRVTGFAGAFSSRATFDQLTIADDEGIWLTITDGAISWNRAALLSGRIEIAEMSAGEIDLPRSPAAAGPQAEAQGFSLPELPVAVSIGALRADRVSLGEALFGAAAEVSLNGSMTLAGGEGATELAINRIDGRKGRLTLAGSYANATRQAAIDLLVSEAQDGIAANLLGLPGVPPIELAIHGSGPIDRFETGLAVSTDGAPRLSGKLTLITETGPDGSVERRFLADVKGDISPLLLPEYRDFVGQEVTLAADGSRQQDGQLTLSRFVLGAEGLDLSGRLMLSPEGLPRAAALTARMGMASNEDMLLPLPGEKTYVRSAELRLRYDAARGEAWQIDGDLFGFRRSGFAIGRLGLDGTGTVAGHGIPGGGQGSIDGEIAFAADAIGLDDPALAEAVGTSATGTTALSWRSGGALKLTGLGLKGAGLAVTGDLSVAGPDTGLAVSGEVAAQVADLARFSSLAGRPLGGSADMTLAGEIGLLSGLLDVETTLAGHDLRVGQPELDQLLRGAARVEASVARDTDGIILRRLNATAQSLTAALSGRIATGSADLDARFAIADLSALGQTYGGTVSATANLTEAGGLRTVTLAATTKDVKTGQPAANQLLAGTSDLRLEADEREGKVLIRSFALSGQEITASGTGQLVDGRNQLDLTAKLRDIALFAPEFPGPLSLDGQVGETPTGYLVDLAAEGPGATSAQIKGALNADLGETDLRIAGSAQSALANAFIAPRSLSGPVRFDLAMVGPPALRSLSGRIDADGMRLVAPALGLDLRNMTAGAELSGATARLTLGAEVAGGGRLSLVGPVNLGAPYTADLALRLAAVRLRDPDLFDTSASGDLSITGPLTGGARIAGSIALGPTEVRIATTGLGGQNDIGAVLHVNEPAEVHRTRARAGLIDDGNGTGNGGAPYQLDLLISAPGRIFVRGRGLDAELGGALRVGGTTDNILPSGQFDLVRGRLDILAKRLTIDEGMIQLQGALQPYIRFAASTQSDGITATVLIEGEATEPDIRFTSVPELPEEEVIAQLLFGRDLSTLSPFQALRLASAVATLAGRGGDDIVTRLRNSFGLDDLDVISDEDGTASLKVGKYLSEKVYTDVTIGPEGKSEINLNLDVRPGLSVRGSLDQEGGTGIGLFYEKDY